MAKLNHHYQKLKPNYIFVEIEKTLKENPSLLNLGIGDFTTPLFPPVVKAMKKSADEMGSLKHFKGYGPSSGYLFLKEKISEKEYQNRFSPEEIFISDGINSDICNIQEIFSTDSKIAVADPAYPAYVDANVMAGRTKNPLKTGGFGGVSYMPLLEENGFQPQIPNMGVDLIYLCSPHNPTGIAMDRKLLEKFVAYARDVKAVILYDGAYESFITTDAPRSIYEIRGAKEVAIEMRSFSKSAGFTGLRCSYTVIPKELKVQDAGATYSLLDMWTRRVNTKSNGVSYPIQKAALSLYTEEGEKYLEETKKTYLSRAGLLKEGLSSLGYKVFGGTDAPYIWCKTPHKLSSKEFFDFLIQKGKILTVPGPGFGMKGEGFVRFSAFGKESAIHEALHRLEKLS